MRKRTPHPKPETTPFIFIQDYKVTYPRPKCLDMNPPCKVAQRAPIQFTKGQVVDGIIVRNTVNSEPPNFVIVQGGFKIPFGGRAQKGGYGIVEPHKPQIEQEKIEAELTKQKEQEAITNRLRVGLGIAAVVIVILIITK
jgi:hypothetical protein